jgi:hypothetical protein
MSERIAINDMLTLEALEGGKVALELRIGEQRIVSNMPAHEVFRLAALITRASLETVHRIIAPASYDLVYTLAARGTSYNLDAAVYLATVHEETVAAPARAALEIIRARRKGDR